MTSYSVCRAWAPVFFSILRSQETSPEVTTGSYCYVDHPLKVKQSGPTRHIYAYLKVMERQGTWYVVDAWITDPSGREKLAESTFLVPTREPDSDVENYKAEWDIFLRMFLVCCVRTQATSNVAHAEPVNEEYDQRSDCTGQTVEKDSDNEESPSLDADTLLHSEPCASQPEVTMDHERLDALLRPENFNWADEDDEDFSAEEVRSPSKVDNDEGPIQVKIPDGPLIVDSSRRVAEQESHINDEGPFASPDLADSGDQMLQDDIDAEFRHREEMIAWASTMDWKIHHFNWYGQAVYEYSDTPPAVSLWYIVSQPKVPTPSDEMRVQSILSRATKFIDPVVYFGRDWRDLQRRGQDLVRAVTGDVFKCYTLHGMWRGDEKHFNEETRVDQGIKEGYKAPHYVIANGFSTHPAVMNITEREEARQSLSEYKRSIDPFRYTVAGRRDRSYALSPLRSSASVDEEWEDESEIANRAPTVDSGLYSITEEPEEGNDNNISSTRTTLEDSGNMSEKEFMPESQVFSREDNALQHEGPSSYDIEDAMSCHHWRSQSMHSTTPEHLDSSVSESRFIRSSTRSSATTTCSPDIPDQTIENPGVESSLESRCHQDVDTNIVSTDGDATDVYDGNAYLRGMDAIQEIVDDIEYPDLQADDTSHSGSVRDRDNDQILDDVLSPSLQPVSSDHHCLPQIEDYSEVRTAQQGSCRDEELNDIVVGRQELTGISKEQTGWEGCSSANLDNICFISNPMMARGRKSVDAVIQPTKPGKRHLKRCHSLPSLCLPFPSAVVSPVVDTKDARCSDEDKAGIPPEISDFLVPQSNSDRHYSISTTEQEQLVETATENLVQQGDRQTAIGGPENSPGEGVNPIQNQQRQAYSIWKRFSHHIRRIFCAKTPTEPSRSQRKLKKKMPPRRAKQSVRRTANFILEGLCMMGPYPVEIIF